MSLLVQEIPHATGVLAEGMEISWLQNSFSLGVRDGGSKSSYASLENGHTAGLAKAAVIFFTAKEP